MANTSGGLRFLVVVAALVGTMITLACYGFVAIILVSGQPPGWTSVSRVCEQPDTVTYDGFRYEVHIRQTARLSLFGGSEEEAVISRAGYQDTYGVLVVLNPGSDPEQLTCRWTPEAVELTESLGIVHTVPASVFTGGR